MIRLKRLMSLFGLSGILASGILLIAPVSAAAGLGGCDWYQAKHVSGSQLVSLHNWAGYINFDLTQYTNYTANSGPCFFKQHYFRTAIWESGFNGNRWPINMNLHIRVWIDGAYKGSTGTAVSASTTSWNSPIYANGWDFSQGADNYYSFGQSSLMNPSTSTKYLNF